jgi:CDP-glycerol glycerophosphotransferase
MTTPAEHRGAMTTPAEHRGAMTMSAEHRGATAMPDQQPRISVVLPVSGVEDYLGACLDSVLGQPFPGLEVIAVDDASPDRCGEILDARARQDPRLRVVHLAESAGPGPARNIGMAQATGEYVWFVDPDDLLTAGSLDAVGQALARSHADVLLIDYRSLQVSGRTEPSPGVSLQRRPGAPHERGDDGPDDDGPDDDGTITLAQWPALINRTMTSWSKVIRRDFLRASGVPFPAGIHEDVPVSCAVLLSARRIAVLDRV